MKTNKKEKPFHISPLTILLILVIISVGIIIHINDVLTVNALVIQNDELKKKLNKLEGSNESLQNEIEKLTSLQRIVLMAKELGLEYNKDVIKYFEPDE